jgi:hypothetical protein
MARSSWDSVIVWSPYLLHLLLRISEKTNAIKEVMMGAPLVYTERVGSSSLSPPTIFNDLRCVLLSLVSFCSRICCCQLLQAHRLRVTARATPRW